MNIKKAATCLLLISILLGLSACKQDTSLLDDYSDVYHFETDYNINMEYSDAGVSYISESEDGFYFICDLYLYFMDKHTMESIPLCKKADCLHDQETDPYKKSDCEAFIGGDAVSLFYYDNGIYIATREVVGDKPESYRSQYYLKKYATDGTFLENTYSFPARPKSVIRHRGYMYYTYENNSSSGEGDVVGSYYLSQVSLTDKSETILYKSTLEQNTLDQMFAYGKRVYCMQYGFDPNVPENYLAQVVIYNLESQTYEIMNSMENSVIGVPFILDDSLANNYWFMDYHSPKNKTLYQSDLDGKNTKPWFTLRYDSSRCHWDGRYFYEDNWPLVVIPRDEPVRKITVYKDFEPLCEFDFTQVDGIDLSKVATDHLRISEDSILVKVEDTENSKYYMICIDKQDLEKGSVTPHIIFEKDFDTGGYYTKH